VRSPIGKKLALAIVALSIASPVKVSFAAARNSVDEAQAAFSRSQADAALRMLDMALGLNSRNAAAWNLQCRVYLAQGRWDDAIASCQHAVQIAGRNSEFHLWLGRAYGEKASRSSLVSAYQLAKLTRAEFEQSVALDGHNREALSDLGQYYVEAPRILGGGYAKAEAIAERLNSLDSARACELRAQIAEARKDYAAAEQDWSARITASRLSPEDSAQAWIDLGSFLRRRGRWNEMLVAVKKGVAIDTVHGPALVDGASLLIQANRETALAALWLREYLDGNAQSEIAPAFAVHTELGDLLKKQGDFPAAEREFAAARALSANYAGVVTGSAGE
jgi:tetratricopeptide (TPR) repeat protein